MSEFAQQQALDMLALGTQGPGKPELGRRALDKRSFAQAPPNHWHWQQAQRVVVPRLAHGSLTRKVSWTAPSRGPFQPEPERQAGQRSIKIALKA